MKKLKEMIFRYYLFLMICVTIYACENSSKSKILAINLKDSITDNAKLVSGINIDSIIRNPKGNYKIFVTDNKSRYLDKIRILQNTSFLLSNISVMSDTEVSFCNISVLYQILSRDSNGYHLAYSSSMKNAKKELSSFTMPEYANIIKEIFNIDSKYKEDLIADLNMSLAYIYTRRNDTKLNWAGENLFEFIEKYLEECKSVDSTKYQDTWNTLVRTLYIKKEQIIYISKIDNILKESCKRCSSSEVSPLLPRQ